MDKITLGSEHIKVDGHVGTWYVIASCWANKGGKRVQAFLLEHEEFGDEAAYVIVDSSGKLIMEDVYNGFSDMEDDGWEVELHE